MKKTVKILSMLLIVMITVFAFSNFSFADEVKIGDITPEYKGSTSGMLGIAKNVTGLIRNVAIIASVIIIMVLGVKYMIGSVEEKAEYKKSFMPLIIGIILVVAATTIASFIFNLV